MPNTIANAGGGYASGFISGVGMTIVKGEFGNNSFCNALYKLVIDEADTSITAARLGPDRIVRFTESSGVYTVQHCTPASDFSLRFESENCQFVLSTCSGGVYKFDEDGTFKSFTNTAGDGPQSDGVDANGNVIGMSQQSDGTTYSVGFSYDSQGLITSSTYQIANSPPCSCRRTLYTYYGASEDNGNENDLKTVVQQIYSNGQWVDHETSYYRYYKPGESGGFASGLKYALDSEAFARLSEDPTVTDPFLASDQKVAEYADNYYEYDSQHRATKAVIQGGLLTYTYSYMTSAFADGYNNWHLKTVTTNPDGTQNILYSNYLTQEMLTEFTDGTDRWITYTRYDANGKVIEQATPAAIDMSGTPYDDTVADLDIQLNASAGLISLTTYYASTTATETTAGGVDSYVEYTKIKEGSGGTEILQSLTKYFKREAGGSTSYPMAEQTVYRDTAGTEPITTKYEYTWYTNTTQVEQTTTLFPIVPTSQNGTGAQESQVTVSDTYGRVRWTKDPRGFITYTAYNDVTGAMTQTIADVDMTLMSGYPLNPGWTTPSGGGLQLIMDYESDELGRTTQSLGPSHDINGQPTRTASWSVYKDLDDETLSAQGYATGSGSYTYTLVNPVSISKTADDGSYSRSIMAVRATASGALSVSDTFPQSTWIRWSESFTNAQGQQTSSRVYHNIPESGEGVSGTNYDETVYGYDTMNRQNRMVSPGGTINRIVFDVRGQAVQSWVGTADASATEEYPNGDSGNIEGNAIGNNMKIVSASQYDGGSDGGNGDMTQETAYVDASTTRVTAYTYDFRSRQTDIDGEVDFYQINTYDNLNQVTKVQRKDTTSGGNLIAQSETKFDDRGRIYQSVTYAVDPSTGTVGNSLTDNTWYDAAGNVIKSLPAGSEAFNKSVLDGVGRQTSQYTGFYDGSGTDDPTSLTDNKIFEQYETTYDDASNAVVQSTLSRYHDGTGNGALVAGTNARPFYTAMYYDGVGRETANAVYGNQGNDTTLFSRPTSAPASSDIVLVSLTAYNAGGEVSETTDPKGIVSLACYDNAGRTIRTVENAVDTDCSSGCAANDQNVTVETSYNADGNVQTLTAKNQYTGDQVTTYEYGTTLADSAVESSQFLRREVYPDSTGSNDAVAYTYNRQGQQTSITDQNGSVRDLEYDALGRPTAQKVSTLGIGVDNSVLRIDRGYEVRGMTNLITCYANAAGTGTPVNQVKQTYNDFAQLQKEEQEHDGAVDGSTLAVQYGYENGSSNTIRPTTVSYPNGRVFTYEYGSGDDNKLSRVANLDWNGADVSEYTYLGVSTIVKEKYPVPSVALNYIGSATKYDGFDRFGRVIDQRWTSGSGDADRFQYSYDRNSNRIYGTNDVSKSLATPVYLDELYSYDNLNRLTEMHRGQLVGGDRIIEPALSQTWSLDAAGNWCEFSNYDQQSSNNVVQKRIYNSANEVIDSCEVVGNEWSSPSYGANGNMTTLPQPSDPQNSYTCIYDPWNRLAQVKDGTTTVGEYVYDGLNRRIVTYSPDSEAWYEQIYYNNDWQVLEIRESNSETVPASPRFQYVWSERYIDAPVLRSDLDLTPEIVYYTGDASFDISSLIDESSNIVERYTYQPYGDRKVFDADWNRRNAGSQHKNSLGFTGQRLDEHSGLYLFRRRYFLSTVGAFLSRDEIGYSDGINLYRATFVPNRTDPFGTAPTPFFPMWSFHCARKCGENSLSQSALMNPCVQLCIHNRKPIAPTEFSRGGDDTRRDYETAGLFIWFDVEDNCYSQCGCSGSMNVYFNYVASLRGTFASNPALNYGLFYEDKFTKFNVGKLGESDERPGPTNRWHRGYVGNRIKIDTIKCMGEFEAATINYKIGVRAGIDSPNKQTVSAKLNVYGAKTCKPEFSGSISVKGHPHVRSGVGPGGFKAEIRNITAGEKPVHRHDER